MIFALALALLIGAVNISIGRLFGRLVRTQTKNRFWWVEGLGFALRFIMLFGAAHWVWTLRHRAEEVVVFILVGAVGQMVGQIYFFLRHKSMGKFKDAW